MTDQDSEKSFAELLGSVKAAKRLTTVEVCREIHTPHRTVESWLSGARTPAPEKQREVIAALTAAHLPPSRAVRREMQRKHGLTWEESKQRWRLRLTIDMGRKIVGKRITVDLKVRDPKEAVIARAAVVKSYQALGLTVRERVQRKGGRA